MGAPPTHLTNLKVAKTPDGAATLEVDGELGTLKAGRGDAAPENLVQTVAFVAQANAQVVDSAFLIAQRKWKVAAIRQIHGTAGTDAGAVGARVRKATGTQAPSAGVALHTADFDLKAAVNTAQVGTLTATAADLELAVGDRLAADIVGVATAVAGLVIEVDLIPV